MKSKIIDIDVSGLINRRDNPDQLENGQVIMREGLMVIGAKAKKLKKCPGSDRLNSVAVGSSGIASGIRYYTKNNFRRTYFFSGGTFYHIDDLGNTNPIMTVSSVFDPTAVPCYEEMRVSETDRLYVSEGVDTGMLSYDGNTDDQFNKEVAVSLNFVGMKSYLDRLWGFEEDSELLYFSVNLDPTNFTDATDAGVISIGAKRGEKIQAIILDNQVMYIFKTDSIWVLEGDNVANFRVRELASNIGLRGRHSLIHTGVSILGFMSDFEVWSFNGTQESMKKLTYLTALGGDLTKDLLPIVNKDRTDQMRAVFHNDCYRLAFTEDGQTTNNMEWVFNTINETDWFTRGNNVGCYIKYDRVPDKQELLTGRSDTGFVMMQYRGLNYDNQATSSTMSIKLQTKFIGNKEPRNLRVKRYWMNSSVLGALPIPISMRINCRTAQSDQTTDNMKVYGEYKSPTTFMRIPSQNAITARQTPRHNNSKCRNFSLVIDEDINNRDFEMVNFQAEIVQKNLVRSERTGV